MTPSAALKAHAIALLALALAVGLRLAFEPLLGGRLPYITVFAAVAVTTWRSGTAPALLTAVAGFLAINLLIPGHPGARGAADPAFPVAVFGFSLSSAVIVAFGIAMRRAQRRLAGEVVQRTEAQARAVAVGERLQATLRSIGDGVIVCDALGRVSSMNPVAESLTGWPEAHALGRPLGEVFDIVDERTREPVPNPAERAMAAGQVIATAHHTVLRTRGGGTLGIDDSAAPVRGTDGAIEGAVLVFRDITARRQADAALRRNEALLRGLYEGTSLCMGVVELLPDGDILHLQDNAGTCRLLQVPPGSTVQRRSSELGLPPQLVQLWAGHYRDCARQAAPVSFEYAMQAPTGLRWFRATVAPLPADGDAAGPRFSYLAEDITARHAAELLVRQSEANARLALQVAEIGTWSWNPHDDLLEADARSRSVAGLPAREALVLDDLLRRVHDEDRPELQATLQRAAAPGGGACAGEFRFVHADGSVRWVVLRGQILAPAELGPLMHCTMLDITARKESEQALAGSDRRKNEFLATLAHELRNPLAPLRNGLAVLRLAGDDEPTRTRAVATLERQLGLMVRLIDDLLDLSRINRDQLELRRLPVDLAAVVQGGVEMSQPLIVAQQHRLTVDLPPRPVIVDGDAARLTQVLANLLNNAAKYTPAGGSIHVRVGSDAHDATLEVEDTGIGIPRDMLGRVFEMFSQVDRSMPQSQAGLGIGLAISRRLVELHGGTLTAHSAGEGRGSRFVASLPVAPSLFHADERPAGTADGTPGRRVLVVDDNVDAANSLCELLSLSGHSARAAHHGVAALALAAQWGPEVVLLDLGMPQMDGYEVARQLRQRPGADALTIVAMTGWGQAEDRQRTQAAGFDAHLVKPVELEAVLQMLAHPPRQAQAPP